MNKHNNVLYFIFFILCMTAHSADIRVPNLEIYSIGSFDEEDNKFKIRTISDFDVNIRGGYKFEGNILLGYDNEYMEDNGELKDYNKDGPIDQEDAEIYESIQRSEEAILFRGANIKILEFAGTPLELTYFTGEFDIFLTGDIFMEEFGSLPVGTRYRGYKYFPGIDEPKFDGLYQAVGTGLALSTGKLFDSFRTTIYTYQDNEIAEGFYSSDISSIFNFEHFKSEILAGVSYPNYGDPNIDFIGRYGTYRGGLLMFFESGTGGELLTQVGLPSWDPETDSSPTSDHLYFLFEPRIRAGLFSFILTYFKHPKYYMHEQIDQEDQTDYNFNLMLGDIYKTKFSGGLEITVQQNQDPDTDEEQYTVYGSPYFTTVMSGVIFDFKVRVRGIPYDEGVTTMFEGIIGIKAEF